MGCLQKGRLGAFASSLGELVSLLRCVQVLSSLGPAQVSFDLPFHQPNLN